MCFFMDPDCSVVLLLSGFVYHNFHSLEVVDRVSETQLQVGENSPNMLVPLVVTWMDGTLLHVHSIYYI